MCTVICLSNFEQLSRKFFRQPDSVGTALSFTGVLFRQPDSVGTSLSFTAVHFFVNAFFSDVAQRTPIKAIREVLSYVKLQ